MVAVWGCCNMTQVSVVAPFGQPNVGYVNSYPPPLFTLQHLLADMPLPLHSLGHLSADMTWSMKVACGCDGGAFVV